MDRGSGMAIADRFGAYVGELTKVVGHADRAGPLRDYCSGLLATEGRRSVEPMAAVTAPAQVSAQHQKLLHFVANSEWSDDQMLAKVRDLVMPSMTRHGPIEAWIIDDTSFPKKGRHSVGVHHQYCGQLGKQANCQVAVTLSIANHHGSLPIAYRLYLPRAWTGDRSRRAEAHVPRSIRFKTKPQLALEQIRAAVTAKVACGAVLIDASYGTNSGLRRAITGLGLDYVAAIVSTVKVRAVREDNRKPKRVSVEALARSLPKHAWRTITWRDGSNEKLRSRFASVRVRAAPIRGEAQFAEEILLIEWPKNEAAPTKFWLATVDHDMPLRDLVDLAKLRWRIERDYQELKQEIGLGHYEGRTWRGFHHHGTMSIAAYGFLISERERIPPSGPDGAAAIEKPALPRGYRPRGAPDPAATPRSELDRNHPSPVGGRDCSEPATMLMLHPSHTAKPTTKFVIQ
ncbi:SRSO17 transposase [Bradyrhizobium sp. AZCC 2230]|jgi:SRSO17 transposase